MAVRLQLQGLGFFLGCLRHREKPLQGSPGETPRVAPRAKEAPGCDLESPVAQLKVLRNFCFSRVWGASIPIRSRCRCATASSLQVGADRWTLPQVWSIPWAGKGSELWGTREQFCGCLEELRKDDIENNLCLYVQARCTAPKVTEASCLLQRGFWGLRLLNSY